MNALIAAAVRCSLFLLVPTATYAIDAQWDLNPGSGDWNTPANWTPDRVPNGPNDVATFGLSNVTAISFSADTEVSNIIFTPSATNPYSFTVSSGRTLTLSGLGISNNSGVTQHFSVGDFLTVGQLRFKNRASAGNAEIVCNTDNDSNPSTVDFLNRSTAGTANIVSQGGSINFSDHAAAGNMNSFIDSGSLNFFDHASARHAQIGVGAGRVTFSQNSMADSANINLGDTVSVLQFRDSSTAGSANIVSQGGFIDFSGSSSAGRATIIAGGFLSFSGSSSGGSAQIVLVEGGSSLGAPTLDISGHDAPGVTIGSLTGVEGFFAPNPFVLLGANNLTVGTNNLSTTFAGTIEGIGGSLTKVGTGTLILSQANTYTGDTNVNRGALQVDGSIASHTLVKRAGSLTGTGTIHGAVTNQGNVTPGSPTGALRIDSFTQANYANLMIQIANTSNFGALSVLGTANVDGQLIAVLLNGFVPAVGDSFTFLTAGSLNGTFFMRNRNIDSLAEHWEITYFPTYALLTVAAGNVSVPDSGSTLLLLMLGLVGLLMCGRRCCVP